MLLRHRLGWGALFVALSLALLVTRRAAASEPPARVSVLTMGPGEHPFTRFGHNALLLEWDGPGRPRSMVYNFGTFAFDGLRGVNDFMAGRFRYWLSVSSLDATLRSYAAAGRSLTAQELALTEPERAELAAALADNALPQHRYYDYDYYRDNCSTRVRDSIDRLLRGELRRGVTGPGRLSFRQHTLRLTAQDPWLYLGLDLALGAPTDRPTTRWEELFLPQELHDALGHAQRQLDQASVPLVRVERRLLESALPAPPREPPSRTIAFGAGGSLLGALLAALGAGAARRRALRVVFGAASAVLGAAIGLLGSALALFWASKHWAAHDNRSLLACPPWALGLVVAGVLVALDSRHAERALRALLTLCMASTSLLLLLALFPAHRESARTVALFLPLWSGWRWGARLIGPSSQR